MAAKSDTKVTVIVEADKETKRTFRFPCESEHFSGAIYINKSFDPNLAKKKVKITLEVVD